MATQSITSAPILDYASSLEQLHTYWSTPLPGVRRECHPCSCVSSSNHSVAASHCFSRRCDLLSLEGLPGDELRSTSVTRYARWQYSRQIETINDCGEKVLEGLRSCAIHTIYVFTGQAHKTQAWEWILQRWMVQMLTPPCTVSITKSSRYHGEDYSL